MSEALREKISGTVERKGNWLMVNDPQDGALIAHALLKRRGGAFPHYSFEAFHVVPRVQGKSLGSHILNEAERISKKEGMPLVLSDDVNPEQNEKAVGMYAKRTGWIEIPKEETRHGHRMYIFGDPADPAIMRLVSYLSPKKNKNKSGAVTE